MKMLTLNCHSWHEENQLEKIKILAETIKEQSYDVIALQEVSQSINAEIVEGLLKKDNYVLVLLNELKKIGITDYHFYWDDSHYSMGVYEEGLAILTKHPIEETRSFYITESKELTNWKARKIVGVKIRLNEEIITFYSCHLGWWNDSDESFKGQVDSLLSKVSQDETFFLLGDFNNDANIRAEGYDYLLSKGLFDTYQLASEKDEGSTISGEIAGWDDNKHDLRIDCIFSSSSVAVRKSNVIFNGINKPAISDHFGVEIELV